MHLSLFHKPLTKCNRCGFKTPTEEGKCHYCHELTEEEVEKMLHEHSINFKGNQSLIKRAYLLLTCILLFLFLYKFLE